MSKPRNLLMNHFKEEAPAPDASSASVFSLVLARLQQTSRLMCGVPDYDTYVRHLKANHPDQPIPTYEDFFRQCQMRRFGDGMQARCC